jgi:hypothetical protein
MTITNYLDESNSRRLATRSQRVAPQTTVVRSTLYSGSFRSGGVLPRYAIRDVVPMMIDISTHRADAQPVEFLSEDFPTLKPQGLFETVSHAKSETEKAIKLYQQFTKAKEVLHYNGSSLEDISKNVVARVEDLLSLIVLLSEVRSVHGLLATVQLYVRTHFTAPLTPIIWSYIKPQIDKLVAIAARMGGFEPQAGYEDDTDKTEIIIKSLRSAIKDWKRHREGPFAKAFGGLISILVAFGIP